MLPGTPWRTGQQFYQQDCKCFEFFGPGLVVYDARIGYFFISSANAIGELFVDIRPLGEVEETRLQLFDLW